MQPGEGDPAGCGRAQSETTGQSVERLGAVTTAELKIITMGRDDLRGLFGRALALIVRQRLQCVDLEGYGQLQCQFEDECLIRLHDRP
ncbi:hypothetical protein OHA25_60440 (plasmid) [Nonomuraea sp. NBC_00507]|uniref:hypothetical protein n=1 Tax=Nonomuraea sp. NBC_00507 TaxID=2976002 RepID=UPI002E18BA90